MPAAKKATAAAEPTEKGYTRVRAPFGDSTTVVPDGIVDKLVESGYTVEK